MSQDNENVAIVLLASLLMGETKKSLHMIVLHEYSKTK